MKQKKPNKPIQPSTGKPPVKGPLKKEQKKSPDLRFFLDDLPPRTWIWITLGLTALLILIIFQKFIAGNAYYLFRDIGSDTVNGWFPNVAMLSRYLPTDGFPLWSHAQGMGQNTMAVSVTDPFAFIVLLFGKDNLPTGMVWMEITKIMLGSFLMFHLLKLWKLPFTAILTGTILLCFGGVMIVGGSWFGFSAELVYLVFILFAFEKQYQEGQWYYFPLAVALITAFQPFDLYLFGLFLILYFLFRHFSGENPNWKKFFSSVLWLAGLTIAGIMISSFLLVSQMQMLLDSPRVGGNSSHASALMSKPVFGFEQGVYYATGILRLLSNDLLGNGSQFRGWGNYLEAPIWYIGLLPLLLMPQIFTMGSRRKAVSYGIFLAFLVFLSVFPWFRYAFWLFTGDYFRGFSVFLSLVFLFGALDVFRGLFQGKKLNLLLLGGTLVFWLILLYYPYDAPNGALNTGLRTMVTNFLVLDTILLALTALRSIRPYMPAALVAAVVLEAMVVSYGTVNDRSVLTHKDRMDRIGYDDYTREAIAFIKDHDKSFFRVNKDYSSGPAIHGSLNDAKVQDYYGTTSYHSFNQKYYIRFQEEMGIIQKGVETQTRWATGLMTRPLLQNFGSTKYQLCKRPAMIDVRITHDSIGRFGDVSVFRNAHFLPLGFTYDRFIPLSELKKATPGMRDLIIQSAFAAEEPLDPRIAAFKPYDMKDTAGILTFERFFELVKERKSDTLAISRFGENFVEGTISPKTRKMLFISIPYDKGWHATLDGKEIRPILCNIGFMGFIVEPGSHKLTLNFRPPYFTESLALSVASLLFFLAFIAADLLYFRRKRAAGANSPQNVN